MFTILRQKQRDSLVIAAPLQRSQLKVFPVCRGAESDNMGGSRASAPNFKYGGFPVCNFLLHVLCLEQHNATCILGRFLRRRSQPNDYLYFANQKAADNIHTDKSNNKADLNVRVPYVRPQKVFPI